MKRNNPQTPVIKQVKKANAGSEQNEQSMVETSFLKQGGKSCMNLGLYKTSNSLLWNAVPKNRNLLNKTNQLPPKYITNNWLKANDEFKQT